MTSQISCCPRFGWLALASAFALTLSPADTRAQGVGAWQPVKDSVGFFTPAAKEKADRKVAEIKKSFGNDFLVEAMAAPSRPKDLDPKDSAAVDRFFDRFAETRFSQLHENGVYLLIINNPHKFRVVVGNNTMAKGYFTEANRSALISLVRDKLKAGDHDGALLAAADYVYESMNLNHGPVRSKSAVAPAADVGGDHRPSSGFGGSSLLGILAVVVVVGLVFAVLRALFSGGGAGAPGMGGGGFMSSLLGGLFGAAAGMWLYNSFFGGGTSSAWGSSDPSAGSNSSGGDAADTSGTAGGGDYGNDAGGGDWGGGGDVGGGDWGGGGGDWGGGGGGGDW